MLSELFSPGRIIVGETFSDRRSLFERLVSLAAAGEARFPAGEAVAALERREALSSTAIRPGLALPHAKLTLPQALYGAAALVPGGVAFAARDGAATAKVELVFMILSDQNRASVHLAALKALALVIDAPACVAELMRSPDAVAFCETFARYERKYARSVPR